MQHPVRTNPARPNSADRPRRWLGFVCLIVAGCGGESTQGPGGPAKPFSQVSLTLRCPDPTLARAVKPAAESWATLKGAKIALEVGAMTPGDTADVGIIPAAEFGAWAEKGELTPVPDSQRKSEHPFQWTSLLPAYREHLIEWGGQARAMPLAGDGHVIVYRADRLADPKFVAAFRASTNRAPSPPASWEDFAELAAALTAFDGKPSLPALSGAETADLFFRVAACYDRRALTDADVAKLGSGLAVLSFQHDATTGEARLDTPGFRVAADWIAGLTAKNALPKLTAAGSDPVAALGKGEASLAVLSLTQLGRLPRENGAIPSGLKVAPLPGARRYFDPEKKGFVPAGAPNYVPYFSGGWLGVVRSRCPHAEAAFDLLSELGGPTRSLEIIGTPGLGGGAFRTTHLDSDRLPVWFGYGFDPDRSRALQDAMRAYVRTEVKNPAYGLRGPDQAELNAASVAVWEKVARGEIAAPAGLDQLIAAWKETDAKTLLETRRVWRKRAAGVN